MSETRVVRVNLGALTRKEWSGLVRVPVEVVDLWEVADRVYDYLDGSEFTTDLDYWEKGDCYTDDNVTDKDVDDGPIFQMDEDYQITKEEKR